MTLEGGKSPIPSKWGGVVYEHFQMFPNDTVDFSQPFLRRSLKEIYPLFVAIYGLLILAGLVANVTMAMNIIMKRLYIDSVCSFLLNIAFCNLLICIAVLPLSLAILLIENWVYGRLLCYLAPMLQDLPVHASTMSLLAISIERYKSIVVPQMRRIPRAFVIFVVWFLAICVVLPYIVYMNYLDLEKYLGEQFKDVGICISLHGEFAQYIRGLFIIVYAFPLTLIVYFHFKITSSLKSGMVSSNFRALDQRTLSKPRYSRASQGSRGSHGELWTPQEPEASTPSALLSEPEFRDEARRHSFVPQSEPKPGPENNQISSMFPGGNNEMERRDQMYLSCIALAFGLCLCPLMILRLLKNLLQDTSSVFDLTLISFVWVAFLPTLTTPALYGLWRMNRCDQNRLQNSYPISSNKFPQSSDLILCSNANIYESELPLREVRRSTSGHRLSIEASLSVNTHMHPHARNMGRPLTPTPTHSRGMGNVQNSNFGQPQRNVRSMSLSYN